jgi:hypothetical protein
MDPSLSFSGQNKIAQFPKEKRADSCAGILKT